MAPSFDQTTSLPVQPTKSTTPHIFAPLDENEIKYACTILKSAWPEGTELYYNLITLDEPKKTEGLKYIEAEHAGGPLPVVDRRAWIVYCLAKTDKSHEAIVNLSTQTVERNVRMGPGLHAGGSGEEIINIEKVVLTDPSVQEKIKMLQMPKGTVIICDPWPYGTSEKADHPRLFQCHMYARHPDHSDDENSNHYALPLPFSPLVDAISRKVLSVENIPTGKDHTTKEPERWKRVPPNEYMPKYQELRTDVKPLHVTQPEGASFTVTQQGTLNKIHWQKWDFSIAFNHREGMVLYDVRYDGRPLFYRLSLSDMNIPYADPRKPFRNKSAFDLGDAGAGIMANDLKLGCDCLGAIHYLDGVLADESGDILKMPNSICIHEQDAGIAWKHTNYRTGTAAVARSRELVLQSIITVANYEYILAFMFNTAAECHYEVRATGILSTQPIDHDLSVPWGTVVHPGVLAPHHQHIFSLRIDPMIDGPSNRVIYEEAHAMPMDDFNPHGNGYYVQETLVETSGGFDTDYSVNRTFKIQNASSKNPINGKNVGYKIVAPPFQKILSHPDSWNYKRAEFSDRNIYVVKHRDDELFSGGKYTNQSHGGHGVRAWANRKDGVVDEDIVVYVQFGMNHIPRIEDFGVMPSEVIRMALKPVNFFTRSPAIDIPPSTQAFNKSTLLSEKHRQPVASATVDAQGGLSSCCNNGNGATNGSH